MPDGIPDVSTVSLTPPPNSASDGNGNEYGEESRKYEKFFDVERGSISRSTARCSVYTVFVHVDDDSLTFTPSFTKILKARISMAQQSFYE